MTGNATTMRLGELTVLVLAFVAIGAASPCSAQQSPPDGGVEIAIDGLRRLVEDGYLPGGVVAWIDEEARGAVGLGRLAWHDDRRPRSDTLYEIGSVTKVVTALLLAEAVRRDEVRLDDRVAALLPEGTPLADGVGDATLAQLSSHASGLPRMPHDFRPGDAADPFADYDAGRLMKTLGEVPLRSEPGSSYEYSNLGAGLLGFLLERRAGSPWPELVAERIAAPLGMKDLAPEARPAARERLAPGYDGVLPVPSWRMSALAGAGDLVASADDLLSFLAAAIGLVESPLRASFDLISRPRREAGGGRVGLGWHLQGEGDRLVVWHNGGTGGYRSFVGYSPAARRGLVLLVNGNAPDLALLGLRALDPLRPDPMAKVPRTVAVPMAELERRAGDYALPTGASLELRRVGNHLTIRFPLQPPKTLHAVAEDEHLLLEPSAACRFLRDEDGAVRALEWRQGPVHFEAERR